MVSGKEGKMTFAGLGGELGQTDPVVRRGYKHGRMTSERK